MHLPEALLGSLSSVKGYDEESFIKVHEAEEQVTSVRLNPLKLAGRNFSGIDHFLSGLKENIAWTQYGYYLESRPSFTFDPLFHAGCYYVQEASSMFLEHVLKQSVDLSTPLKVLDLCAAPGGKSTHLLSLLSKESLLVSNEVIKSRSNILRDNITKWGHQNVVVTNNDPKDFQRLKNYFDVIVVDAPCSGSGLFRRDPTAINEWSEENVSLCSHRQQRILADILPALKPGGVIIYSTCSYSKEEDENIVEWLEKDFTLSKRKIKIEEEWGIVEKENGYRFWPDKVKGEGFFIACLIKNEEEPQQGFKPKLKFEKISNKEKEIIDQYVKIKGSYILKNKNSIVSVPEKLINDIDMITRSLRVVQFGISIGEIIRDKLIPGHSLAMSRIIKDDLPTISLETEQAVLYLKKKEIKIDSPEKGWAMVSYNDFPLGWINILPNRINNYYPKELRILKD